MITNETAIKALQVINAMLSSNDKYPTKFVYAIIKNKQLLEPVLKAYNDTIEKDNDSDFLKLKTEWDKISKEYALLDHNKKPTMKNDGSMVIDPDRSNDFNIACMEIVAKKPVWQEALTRRTKMITDLQQSDSKLDPFSISIDSFPEEMNGSFMECLAFLVE